MAYPVEKSRRILLNRDTFDFSDLDEVLEWVDFFNPSDAAYTIEKFESLTGKDFKKEYRYDFMREYIPPSDDEPMKEVIPEPSEELKREILFYWDQLYHPNSERAASRPYMLDQTPEGIDEWNKTNAPKVYALYQMDKTGSQDLAEIGVSADSQPSACCGESFGPVVHYEVTNEVGRGDCATLT